MPAALPLPSGTRIAWPGECRICRRWGRQRLCEDCLSSLAPATDRCRRCGIGMPSPGSSCDECLDEPPPFDRTTCLADYGPPWDRLIADFKFHDQPELAAVLAAGCVHAARAAGMDRPDVFVPVPLARERLAARGYNQAWELARQLARLCGVRAEAEALMRRFDAPPQAGQTRSRRKANLRGAFAATPRTAGHLEGRHVALVDDVMTTGTTAREAAGALRAAGAARVDVWVVARTAAD